jgi:CBS domain-containing protein
MQRHAETRTVRDVMTQRPFTVSPETRLADLRTLFETRDYNTFPVVDAAGTLLGIATKLDFLRVFRPDVRGRNAGVEQLLELQVADVMRPGVITLEPDLPLAAAVDLMLESRLHSLPVVERRHGGAPVLVGILSRGDLLASLMSAAESGEPPAPSRPPGEAHLARR